MKLLRCLGLLRKDKKQGIGLSLFGLVLVAVLPLLVFGCGVAWIVVDQKKSAIADELASTTRALRVAVDRELVSQFAAMEILAADVSLDTGNLAAFHDMARRVLAVHDEWHNAVLIDPNSHTIVAGGLPLPTPAPKTSSPDEVDQVARTRQPMIVGVLAAGKIVQKPIIQFLAPVVRDNKVRFVLAVVMNPQPISEVFVEQRLPPAWTGAIVDSRMTLAGRSRDPERFVGKRSTPTLADRIAASESGMFTALNQEGATVYTVFSRSQLTGWSVAIGVPAAEVEGPIRLVLLQLTIAGSVLVTFALILTGLVGRGIVQRRNTYEQALYESEQRYHFLFDNNPMPMWVYAEGSLKFLVVNDRAIEHYGYTREEFSRMTLLDIRPPEDIPEFHRALPTSLEIPAPREWRHKKKDGTIIDVAISVVPMMYDDVPARIVLVQDITERKQAEEKLHLAASVFSHAREGIVITAADGEIIDVNDAFSLITGYSRDEALGRNPRFLSSGRQKKDYYDAMWRDLIEKGHWYGEIWNRRKSGEVYAIMQTISTVRDAEGNPRQYVALFSDITALKEHQQQLEHIAHYDALTGLPNRVLLADRLYQAMAQTERRGKTLAVAYLDLDGFKAVNDSYGHETGDQLLMILATRMKQALREGDTLARLGGDEFVAVLIDLEDAAASEPMLARLLSAAAQPVPVGDRVLQVSASIGITFYPQAQDIDADQLLRQADQAMYQAKLAGKNRYHVLGAGQDSCVC